MTTVEDSRGAVEEALDGLLAAIEAVAADRRTVHRRANAIRRQLRAGRSLADIVPEEEQPLIVQAVRDSSIQLMESFARFQRAEAAALYADGMSMERIGTLFGVSRQRIAKLLGRGSAPAHARRRGAGRA
ncbi:MAG TPA: helix-turn-helix domain-containing protein [Acidimicrobiales bacterium]|nr:helix-turn-helix domain-containing protein [Acidimicrobiales bacterium]